MIDKLFDWYQQQTNALHVSENEFFDKGTFYSTNYYYVDVYIFEGLKYFLKRPHSASYKEKSNELSFRNKSLDRELTIKDNELCTMSELISEKKYRAYKYLVAKHFTLPVGREFYVASPNMFFEDVEAAEINGLDDSEEYCEPAKVNLSKNARLSALGTSRFNLEQILKNKNNFLGFMTEHCYEQFVNYFLMSAFEFSDDENSNNLMFAKPKDSDRFENVFVFDKESTLFNFLIAQGESFESIKQKIAGLDEFCDVVLGGGNFVTRVKILRQLFEKGLLNEKHQSLLKTTLNVNYDKLAQEVSAETGLKKNQSQIDLYKLGQDYTNELLKDL